MKNKKSQKNKQKIQKNRPQHKTVKTPAQKSASKPRGRAARPPQKQAPKSNINISAALFGVHAVAEALKNPARECRKLYATKQALGQLADKNIGRQDVPVQIVERRDLDAAFSEGTVHQGLALDCAPLPDTMLDDFIRDAESKERSLLVMLDQVTDPHNVGAIMRSACAFGASGMILQKMHAPELTGVLAKTACGAVEHVPVTYETNLTRSLETLQKAGFVALGLDERGEEIFGKQEMPQKCVLVLGAEGPGLRRLVKEQCDILVRLPMSGAMPSINVSNAAAIALYAVTQ